jgi:hypothetical protein
MWLVVCWEKLGWRVAFYNNTMSKVENRCNQFCQYTTNDKHPDRALRFEQGVDWSSAMVRCQRKNFSHSIKRDKRSNALFQELQLTTNNSQPTKTVNRSPIS